MTTHAHAHVSWTFEPGILVPLAVYAWLWIRRYRTVRRTSGPRGAGPRHLAAFIGSIVALLVAPLLMLLALSRTIMRPLTRRLQTLERALGPFAHPVTALTAWLGLVYLWHVPALYDAALHHTGVHALQHVTFFTAGTLVWWPLIQPVPMRRRLTGMWTLAYVAAAKFGLAALGLYLTWTQTVVYSYYARVPRIWGLSAISDQNVGGAIMMVEQSVLLVTVFAIIFGRMLVQSEEDELRRERLEQRAAAGAP